MRKLWMGLLFTALVVSGEESFAQFDRNSIKKSNRKVGEYKGTKSKFGKQNSYNSVGFAVAAFNYYGDLSPTSKKLSTDIGYTKPGFALSYMHRFGPRYSLQGQFSFGTIKDSDAESADKNDLTSGIYRYHRNLSFRNQIKEFSVIAIIDLFSNASTYMSRVKWTPYVFVGVAGFFHNPQAIAPDKDLQGNPLPEAGKYVSLRPLGTEGQYSTLSPTDVNYGVKPYSLSQFAIPFGLGARFRLNEVMDLSVDFGIRYTFTDYLDDVSGNYVSLTKLNSPLAQAMSYRNNELGPPVNPAPSGIPGVVVEDGYGSEGPDNRRGNKKYHDIYTVTSVRLTYIISPSFHKAKFR